jgi:hypothetical protein
MNNKFSYFVLGFSTALSMVSFMSLQKKKIALNHSVAKPCKCYQFKLTPLSSELELNVMKHLHPDLPDPKQ